MNEKCRHCNEDIHKTPGGYWIHSSLEAQISNKVQIHTSQPLVRMVELDNNVQKYLDGDV